MIAIGSLSYLSSQLEQHALEDIAEGDARETSQLIFLGLYSAMKRGWSKQDIHEILESFIQIKDGLDISLIRGEPVARQYGDRLESRRLRENDLRIARVMQTGLAHFEIAGQNIRYIYPLTVEHECQSCHSSSRLGEINGAIEIIYPVSDVKISLNFAQKTAISLIALLVVALSVILAIQLRRLVVRPLQRLSRQIGSIIDSSDQDIDVAALSPVTELHHLAYHFNSMLGALRRSNGLLDRATNLDALTGILNRRAFFDALAKLTGSELEKITLFSIMLLDVDHLRDINLRDGYRKGDFILATIATAIEDYFGLSCRIGRIAGDTFGVILPNSDSSEARACAADLREHITRVQKDILSNETAASVSIAIVEYPGNGKDYVELCEAVEAAIQKAQEFGTDQIIVLQNSDLIGRRNLALRLDSIKNSIQASEVEIALEPIVAGNSGQIIAHEVLARLRRGDTLVKAGDFIEQVEHAGLSTALDCAVIRKALATQDMKNPDGKKLFFNLAPRTLNDDHAMEEILELFRQADAPAGRVVFEITEREALSRISRIGQLVRTANQQGIKFALDDFGSGFSSFIYLKHLSVQYIKIDGSLVRDITSNASDYAMVRHINALAHEFEIETIAEFVESQEIHEKLKAIDVDYMQGDLFNKEPEI